MFELHLDGHRRSSDGDMYQCWYCRRRRLRRGWRKNDNIVLAFVHRTCETIDSSNYAYHLALTMIRTLSPSPSIASQGGLILFVLFIVSCYYKAARGNYEHRAFRFPCYCCIEEGTCQWRVTAHVASSWCHKDLVQLGWLPLFYIVLLHSDKRDTVQSTFSSCPGDIRKSVMPLPKGNLPQSPTAMYITSPLYLYLDRSRVDWLPTINILIWNHAHLFYYQKVDWYCCDQWQNTTIYRIPD